MAGTLKVVRVPLASLTPDPSNARTHGERNLAALRSALAEFGQVEPLVVRKGCRTVIGGNGRLLAMLDLGWSEADIVEVEVDDRQAKALAIALNRTAELAGWDEARLAAHLAEIKAADLELESLGFDESELEAMLGVVPPVVESAEEEKKLRNVSGRALPEMAWVLIGVPMGRYGQADALVRQLATIPGAICESAASDRNREPRA